MKPSTTTASARARRLAVCAIALGMMSACLVYVVIEARNARQMRLQQALGRNLATARLIAQFLDQRSAADPPL